MHNNSRSGIMTIKKSVGYHAELRVNFFKSTLESEVEMKVRRNWMQGSVMKLRESLTVRKLFPAIKLETSIIDI